MSDIIPAIIPTSEAHLRESLEALTFATRVQIDIVDGEFAKPASWPYEPAGDVATIAAAIASFTTMVDIMASDPLAATKEWLAAGAAEIVVHLETCPLEIFHEIVALKNDHDFLLYIAGDDDLPISAYTPYLLLCDGVQLMGIDEVGSQGQSFSERVLLNIAAFRAAYPELPIVIDGSVNGDTLPSLKAAGATDFVVGSAIAAAPDKLAAYQTLTALAQ